MTYYYPHGNAYEVIQEDVETNFHLLLGKNKEDIKTIVIVGAYHGYEISRLLNIYKNSNIFAFEAVPKHFKILNHNYYNNDRVKLYNLAISDEEGFIDFYELGNGGEGSGSILKFRGHESGHPFKISEVLKLPCVTLNKLLPNLQIDLLWVDVQGAELKVLRGTNLSNCKSLFLEIHTRDYIHLWDNNPYEGQCYKEDLEEYLYDFTLHSIGLDNTSGNGQGNSFWVRKNLNG